MENRPVRAESPASKQEVIEKTRHHLYALGVLGLGNPDGARALAPLGSLLIDWNCISSSDLLKEDLVDQVVNLGEAILSLVPDKDKLVLDSEERLVYPKGYLQELVDNTEKARNLATIAVLVSIGGYLVDPKNRAHSERIIDLATSNNLPAPLTSATETGRQWKDLIGNMAWETARMIRLQESLESETPSITPISVAAGDAVAPQTDTTPAIKVLAHLLNKGVEPDEAMKRITELYQPFEPIEVKEVGVPKEAKGQLANMIRGLLEKADNPEAIINPVDGSTLATADQAKEMILLISSVLLSKLDRIGMRLKPLLESTKQSSDMEKAVGEGLDEINTLLNEDLIRFITKSSGALYIKIPWISTPELKVPPFSVSRQVTGNIGPAPQLLNKKAGEEGVIEPWQRRAESKTNDLKIVVGDDDETHFIRGWVSFPMEKYPEILTDGEIVFEPGEKKGDKWKNTAKKLSLQVPLKVLTQYFSS